VADDVRYEAPGWILEPIAERLLVRPELERVFEFRREVMLERWRAHMPHQP